MFRVVWKRRIGYLVMTTHLFITFSNKQIVWDAFCLKLCQLVVFVCMLRRSSSSAYGRGCSDQLLPGQTSPWKHLQKVWLIGAIYQSKLMWWRNYASVCSSWNLSSAVQLVLLYMYSRCLFAGVCVCGRAFECVWLYLSEQAHPYLQGTLFPNKIDVDTSGQSNSKTRHTHTHTHTHYRI